MAIIEKVTLVDDYSSKAGKIAKSTSAMASAMDSIKGRASSVGSAMKSAFGRSYTVDIKDTGSKYLEGRIEGLKKSLGELNRPYEVRVTSKMGVLDKFKSNLSAIKSQAGNLKSSLESSFKNPIESTLGSFKKFKMDLSAFRAAKSEARQIGKEITAFTGKKHKVHIDMENPIKTAFKSGLDKAIGGLKGGGSKIGGFFSKLNPFKGSGGNASASGDGGGGPGLLGSIVGGNLISGAISKGLGALSGVASSTLGSGFNRLQNIEAAQARLRGFGFKQDEIKGITKSATNAVTGTQYSMGDAMTASSGAIAAGIKPGELEGYLKEVGNAAAATGSDFNDVASIMNKVKTTGHLQADEMRQLSDRGLPVLAKLAENAGISVDKMSERISKGSVSFDEFRAAVKSASGNASEEVAKTWGGATDNFKSALSKLGAGILGGNDDENGNQGGIFGMMTPALLKVNEILNGLVPTFKNVGDAVKDFGVNGFKKLKAGFEKVSKFFAPVIEQFKKSFGQVTGKLAEVWGPLKDKFTSVFENLTKAFAPLKDALSSLFGKMVEGEGNKLTAFIDLVATGLGYFADAINAASPYIQSAVEWISANVIPVIADIVSWVSGTLMPTLYNVAETVMGAVMPVIMAIIDFIGGTLMPVLEDVGTLISGAVTSAFNVVKDAVQWAADKFNALVEAVGGAIKAFVDIPGKITGAIGKKLGGIGDWIKSKVGMNATGTEYFTGGFTQVNERGAEMMRLPTGTKIYPAQKTKDIISREVQNKGPVDKASSNNSIVININGANMTNKDVGVAISNELRRLGVVV